MNEIKFRQIKLACVIVVLFLCLLIGTIWSEGGFKKKYEDVDENSPEYQEFLRRYEERLKSYSSYNPSSEDIVPVIETTDNSGNNVSGESGNQLI